MGSLLQTYVALAIVLLAAVGLIRRFWGGRKKPGCGGGCGCSADEFKKKLRS